MLMVGFPFTKHGIAHQNRRPSRVLEYLPHRRQSRGRRFHDLWKNTSYHEVPGAKFKDRSLGARAG